MDFNDINITDIPFAFLFDIFNRMNVYYCGYAHRAFLYNSKGIEKLWSLAKMILPANALKNIFFIEKGMLFILFNLKKLIGKEQEIFEYIDEYEL
jgi:hypothetical protein